MAVALTLLRLGVTDRQLYLFDTFSGMTPPSEEDVKHTGERAADMLATSSARLGRLGGRVTRGCPRRRCSGSATRKRTSTSSRGRWRRRSREAPERSRYFGSTPTGTRRRSTRSSTSTRSCSGGVLIIDDYAYWQGARKAVDEYIAEHDLPLLLNRIDYTARIAVKPS